MAPTDAHNSLLSKDERLRRALKFLDENTDEKPVTPSRIYDVAPTTVNSARRARRAGKPPKQRGRQNKILQDYEIQAIHNFIHSLLLHDIQPTHAVVYGAILSFKRSQNPNCDPPSQRWFRP